MNTRKSSAYAAGLRLSEGTHLQVSDIDSSRRQINIRQGKGSKQRLVPLTAPKVRQTETVHVVLEVQDRGTPCLWAYRRAIITVKP